MLTTIELAGVWITTCDQCGWQCTQERHVPTLHRCPANNNQLVKYRPPDWASVPRVNPRINPPVIQRPLKPLSIVRKAINFVPAAAKHVVTGRKEVSDEVVAANWAICQGCELFLRHTAVNGECTHPSCGCALKAVGQTGRNKLRWESQVCPIGKWDNRGK
jgi:hypothetical protein